MKNKLLAEIAYSALTDDLCEGCDKYGSLFSYENGGSCQLCRRMAAREIKSILERRKDGDLVSNCHDCPMNPDSDAWMR